VRDNVRWDANDALYFQGDEPCVNGIALANGAYFGQDWTPSSTDFSTISSTGWKYRRHGWLGAA
jgi:hypothetical protein